jgi:hypothetical protein
MDRCEPRVLLPQLLGFAPQLLDPQLERDLPLLALVLQLLRSLLVGEFSPRELDLSHLVNNDGPPVQHRQAAEPSQ